MVVHQCNWCEYSTSRRANLTRHTRKHTGERPFSCSVCPYKAADESSIVAHVRTHTGERPFKCTICDYKASQAAHLRTHLRTHTGERPYPCTLCSYRATTDSALTVHMKVHSDERPFSCTVCSFTSKTKSRMSEHMKIHNKAKDAISESQLSGRLVYEQVAPGQQRFSPPLSGAAHTMDALRHVFDVNASPREIHPNTADQEQARQLDQTLFFGSMGFSPAQIKVAKAGEMRLEVLTEVPNPQTAGQIPLTPPDKSDSESSSTSPLKSNPGWYF